MAYSGLEVKDVELGDVSTLSNMDNVELKIVARRNSSTLNAQRKDSQKGIIAVRSPSSGRLARTESGRVIRKDSMSIGGGETIVANRTNSMISRKQSASSIPVAIAAPTFKPTKAHVKATLEEHPEAMKYIEHEFDFPKLSDFFVTNIDPQDVNNSRGLTTERAIYMLKEFGPNVLTPPERIPLWLLFLLQFNNFFMLLLIGAGILSIIAWLLSPKDFTNLWLGILLLVVVLVTCYETFSQEAKSDQLMETFRKMVPENAMVIRDGVLIPMRAADLVAGDIVKLKSGDKVPCDCRVILNESMKVDQSMITGESEPVDSAVIAHDKNPLEARNIIFSGSLVVDGGSLAVAIRTGDQTLIGGMVELTGDVGKNQSTLKADVEKFVKLLTKIALVQAVIIFAVGWAQGIPPLTAFIQGFIIIMVANVPQGLPTTITVCLSIVADRMGEENVFVKRLDIVETLGSCSVICTDKTGTLTMNLMSVANLWTVGGKRVHGKITRLYCNVLYIICT